MKVKGTEWCSFCDAETDYSVEENEWFVKCSVCGRPTLLCDKCACHNDCSHCPYEDKLNELTKEWEKTQIGRIVYLEKDEFSGGYFKVLAFTDDGEWVLENTISHKVETDYGEHIDFNPEKDA